MEPVQPGPRDHIVTRGLDERLSSLPPDVVDVALLDGAEAPARLARHVMEEIRRELAADDKSSDEQAHRVNQLLGDVLHDGRVEELALPARLLQGIRSRSPLGDVLPSPPLPATPFSVSDLL